MFCYVGKATKIFFAVVAVLVVVGLVVGFERVVHHAGAQKAHECSGAECQPATIPNTIPSSPIPVPNTIPAATAIAVPPIPSPPSPDYAVQGPAHPGPSPMWVRVLV